MRSTSNYDSLFTSNRGYQAILQLRPYDEEVAEFVMDELKSRGNVFITKVVELKKNMGIDLYLTSQNFAKTLSNMLKRRFNGEIKITRTLYSVSKENTKKIYRLTVLFRLNKTNLLS